MHTYDFNSHQSCNSVQHFSLLRGGRGVPACMIVINCVYQLYSFHMFEELSGREAEPLVGITRPAVDRFLGIVLSINDSTLAMLICLSIYLSFYISSYLAMHPSIYSIYRFSYLRIHPSIYLFSYPFIYTISIYPTIHPSTVFIHACI